MARTSNCEVPPEKEVKTDNKMSLNEEKKEQRSIKSMLVTGFQNITVEPFVILYSTGLAISMIISPILYMNKICRVRI